MSAPALGRCPRAVPVCLTRGSATAQAPRTSVAARARRRPEHQMRRAAAERRGSSVGTTRAGRAADWRAREGDRAMWQRRRNIGNERCPPGALEAWRRLRVAGQGKGAVLNLKAMNSSLGFASRGIVC